MESMELHGAHSQYLEIFEEMIEARWVLRPRPPETQAAHKAKVGGVTNGSGTAVDDSSPRKATLQLDDSSSGLGGTRLALVVKLILSRFQDGIIVLIEGNILGLVTFIKHQEAVKILAAPVDNLIKTSLHWPSFAIFASTSLADESAVRREEHASLLLASGLLIRVELFLKITIYSFAKEKRAILCIPPQTDIDQIALGVLIKVRGH
mmetsp:Transcript_11007/g.30897  ORF Transcript_11007/g.30897 Transcript_11007/m.30897 type:complete len:207 (-) Transcript_11007:432-1052(-)